jgi:amino-acid N-acetyltransferase
MTEPAITLEPTTGSDLERVEALLERNDLPYEDVRTGEGEFFLASADGEFVGVGGLETHGAEGLLRSVVVSASRRGRGLGAALVAELEARADDRGVDSLYLLTTTAAAFFERQGFEAVERDAAPPAVRGMTEFRDLCPASATCMRKIL